MRRWLSLILPLVLPFLLSVLPLAVFRFSADQRAEIARERSRSIWKQAVVNRFQMFRTAFSFDGQAAWAGFRFRKLLERVITGPRVRPEATIHPGAFGREVAAALPKAFPAWMRPDLVQGGMVPRRGGFHWFTAPPFSGGNAYLGKKLLEALGRQDDLPQDQRAALDRLLKGAFGSHLSLDLLRNSRQGKPTLAQTDRGRFYLLWDRIVTPGGDRVVYLLTFPARGEAHRGIPAAALRQAFPTTSRMIPVLLPLAEADPRRRPIVRQGLPPSWQDALRPLLRQVRDPAWRKTHLPAGQVVASGSWRLWRDLVETHFPYELLVVGRDPPLRDGPTSPLSFLLSAGVFVTWSLILARVGISGKPLPVSLRFQVGTFYVLLGALPLTVLFVAGTYQIQAGLFREEQDALQELIRSLEETDSRGEMLVGQYQECAISLMTDPGWRTKMLRGGSDLEEGIRQGFARFAAAGLPVDLCFLSRPDSPGQGFSSRGALTAQERGLVPFIGSWAEMGFSVLRHGRRKSKPVDTYRIFSGDYGKEAIRQFLMTRGHGSILEVGEERVFMFTDFLAENGQPRLWFHWYTSLVAGFQAYLREAAPRLELLWPNARFAVRRIQGTGHTTVRDAPGAGGALLPIGRTLLDLAALSGARFTAPTSEGVCVAFPCGRCSPFLLGVEASFQPLRLDARRREWVLSGLLFLLSLPIYLLGRLLIRHLLHPLARIERGLRQITSGNLDGKVGLDRDDELGTLTQAFDRMVSGLLERRNLGRFVSGSLTSELGEHLSRTGTTGLARQQGVILCSDIRQFTSLSETHPPHQVVSMLNLHLYSISKCVLSEGGRIEQIVGDALIGVFVASTLTEAAGRAMRAAVAMRQSHARIQRQRSRRGMFPYEMGVGLAAGEFLAGTLRTRERFEFAVIGPQRELAERLEAASKAGTATRIVIAPASAGLFPDCEFHPLSPEAWELVGEKVPPGRPPQKHSPGQAPSPSSRRGGEAGT